MRAACLLLLCAILTGCARPDLGCRTADGTTSVATSQGCLVVKTFSTTLVVARPVLYVVVHGDQSDGGPATSHFAVAQSLADAAPNAVVAALIRPGYADGEGHVSGGSNNGRRDHYTAANVAAVADAIRVLKGRYAPSRVVLIGHSGGAAIGGIILGRYPGLVDSEVLVSCPCDVPAWRATRGSAWPQSESPSAYIKDVPGSAAVTLISGTGDTVVPVDITRDYAADLVRHGVAAEFIELPDVSHNSAFRSSEVVAAAIASGRR